MLKRFSVDNFKNFKSRITFDLGHPSNYGFNEMAVSKDGTITKALIYGINGCGKSNFALALFDIVLHLTDKQKLTSKYLPYLNLNSKKSFAEFEYFFEFNGLEVLYRYGKTAPTRLTYESLQIDGQEVLRYDFKDNTGYTIFKGAENLNLISDTTDISRVKYLRNNAILEENSVNKAFLSFMAYVDKMLLFYSLDERGYQGFYLGNENYTQEIVKSEHLADFEAFLNKQGVECKLVKGNIGGNEDIFFHFANGDMPYQMVASTGTRSLGLFYYWYLKMRQASLVYIDEYDAFYHFELSEALVNLLKQLEDVQVVLSTHNTDLLSNDLLRPDCYFYLDKGKLNSLASLSEKDIRKAHNLQKMYKAGAFGG